MIQRIQTLYLLLTSGAFASQFALPYLSTDTVTTLPALADGRLLPQDNPGLMGLCAMGVVLAVAAIFLFKNRPLQGKLAGFGMILGILTLVLAAFTTKTTLDAVPAGGTTQWGLGWAGALVGMLGSWLAMRAIRNDEKLVRSMDRLR
jgi:CHASE2 domain-containing sensor protein